jgi:ribosome-associated toxin RatA of RatAB toxin-antitoxin module
LKSMWRHSNIGFTMERTFVCALGIRAAAGMFFASTALAGESVPASLTSARQDAKTVSAGDEAILKRGDVVVHSMRDPLGASGRVEAIIDIPAPPTDVWATMLDCARAPKFVESLESCRVLQRDPKGGWEVREHVVSFGWMLPSFRSVFRADYVLNQSIKFRQLEGDFDVLEGEWRLTPSRSGKGTRLFYQARVGTDLPIPDSLIRDIIEADAPKTLVALRNEVAGLRVTH